MHVGRLLDVIEALPHVSIASRDDVYHTCRTLLVHRREDLPVFDRVFEAFWQARPGRDSTLPAAEAARGGPQDQGISEVGAGPGDDAADDKTTPVDGWLRTWSDAAALADKDFAEFSQQELALATAALADLVWTPGERRTRRWVAGRGSRVDLRHTLRRSVRTAGDVVRLSTRTRRVRQRPLVLLCDVSGSMEPYSRMLLHFAHAIGRRNHRVEAFVFSTGLTRITRELRTRALDLALANVARAVPDWSGGTRIGEALRLFHRRWARRVLHGGPVVLIISDGWDRGDPEMLRAEVRRLQRSCYRLIWLNPLIGTLNYAPLTRGLLSALPFVDDFLPARTLRNIADLAAHLNSLSTSGS